MRAWVVTEPGPIGNHPLELVEKPDPEPGPRQLLVRVLTCGVCRTDLHLAEGDLTPHHPRTTPGHEVVGVVEARGEGATRFASGERVGVPWLGRTDGTCRFCRRGEENLCLHPTFTGWDVDGGYAERLVADEAYVYALPEGLDDEAAAPLLCAGIIGYRSLLAAAVPPGGRLGIWGFGGSAHLTAQVAIAQGLEVHVRTRGRAGRDLADRLGVASVGDSDDPLPQPLDGAILFAPVGDLVPTGLRALDRGGTLAVAGIYLSDVPALRYDTDLFEERRLRSVTANTRADGETFLALAERLGVRSTTHPYAFEHADQALADLGAGAFDGAAVLHVGER